MNDADAEQMRSLTLVKGPERFVVRYEPGGESKALDTLAEWANNPDLDFDWSDASLLSHQLGVHLAKELKPAILTGTTKPPAEPS